MKLKKDGRTYDLSQLPGKPLEAELPLMPVKKTWQPNGVTHTMVYGQGQPTIAPSLSEVAYQQARSEYTYLLENDPIILERAKVLEELMSQNG